MSSNYTLILGDCKKELQRLIADGMQVDSIVTDPPYNLGFMNKSWDKTGIANDVEMWKLCLEILKPGAHLLSFGGSRTYHRMACAIEDAGFQIRDQIMWVYGSGFPKNLDVSKAIDKMMGAEREITWEGKTKKNEYSGKFDQASSELRERRDIPVTDAAKQWSGFGTALKPAHEPIVLARKPLGEKNIASNVLKHGVGGINVDGCRVGDDILPKHLAGQARIGAFERTNMITAERIGRFPANIIHDGSNEVETEFAKYGERKTGSASRFFYCAKPSPKERSLGLQERELKTTDDGRAKSIDNPFQRGETVRRNTHPTVKPLALMKYLCRLVTPPGSTVLDPFMGSGTTGMAATEEGLGFIGIEKGIEYVEIAKARLK